MLKADVMALVDRDGLASPVSSLKFQWRVLHDATPGHDNSGRSGCTVANWQRNRQLRHESHCDHDWLCVFDCFPLHDHCFQ